MRVSKLVVVGTGLIGGSCALALRRASSVETIVGIGRSRANLDQALALGVADRTATLGDDWTRELADADVVLVAAPVAQYPSLFGAIAPAIGASTIVTDAGSTKQDVVAAARAAFGDALPRFVPAHPIAGNERSGASAADATLFRDREVVLTPVAETSAAARERIADLWRTCGARVSMLSPEEHDRIFAAVSHLPHMLAFALVAEISARPEGDALWAHAGSGFRDVTRIAASSPEMWRDIALANRSALLAELTRYRVALDALARSIASGDGDALQALFERAAVSRRRWPIARSGTDDA